MGNFKLNPNSDLTKFIKEQKSIYIPKATREFYTEYIGDQEKATKKALRGLVNHLEEETGADVDEILDALEGVCWNEEEKNELKNIK